MPLVTKTCTLCKRDLPLTEYHDDRRGVLGKSSRCRGCRSTDHAVASSVISMPRLVAVLDSIREEPTPTAALINYELHRDIAVHAYQNTLDRIVDLETANKLLTKRLAEQSRALKSLQEYIPTFTAEVLALLNGAFPEPSTGE